MERELLSRTLVVSEIVDTSNFSPLKVGEKFAFARDFANRQTLADNRLGCAWAVAQPVFLAFSLSST